MTEKKLASQFIKMAEKEQKLRWKVVAAEKKSSTQAQRIWKQTLKTDKENQKVLKSIIKKHGWPTLQMVGMRGARSAWLIVQHSDRDVAFQKKVLGLIEKLYKENPKAVVPSNLAYLRDRVSVNTGKKQIYGTQFMQNKKTEKWEPKPIKDRKKVNKLRKEMDIKTTLAQAQKRIEKIMK